jgi:N-acetylmuramoyl-L-alanine amidase
MQAAWDVAQILKADLEKSGMKVVMTKSSLKQFVKNKDRAGIANNAKADLMVRLHCDAQGGSGFAVYYPGQVGKVGNVSGPSVSVLKSCKALANPFHAAMAKALAGMLKDNGLRTDKLTAIGSKQGALTGSIYSKVPVVLVEMCVLTNPKDEAFISSEKGKRAMASALASGVKAALAAKAAK